MSEWSIIDKQDKSVLLPCLFTYSVIKIRTAEGGVFQQGYHALRDASFPGGLFVFL